jgi:hypothetical protein
MHYGESVLEVLWYARPQQSTMERKMSQCLVMKKDRRHYFTCMLASSAKLPLPPVNRHAWSAWKKEPGSAFTMELRHVIDLLLIAILLSGRS